jgi:hypothetical protein
MTAEPKTEKRVENDDGGARPTHPVEGFVAMGGTGLEPVTPSL